jgi:hypothetical protein
MLVRGRLVSVREANARGSEAGAVGARDEPGDRSPYEIDVGAVLTDESPDQALDAKISSVCAWSRSEQSDERTPGGTT